jgi:hypothetical protein
LFLWLPLRQVASRILQVSHPSFMCFKLWQCVKLHCSKAWCILPFMFRNQLHSSHTQMWIKEINAKA